MSIWTQVYAPIADNILISALVAALPVVLMLGLLAIFRVKAHWAALTALATSLCIAILVYGMPSKLAAAAALDGFAFGLFPIGWIVLCVIFVYDITVKSGDFAVMEASVASVANDRRIQVLLIAFCFGAFIEGAAGFGTPVAISAALLIGLGFRPLQAAGLSLIANTAPVSFGALGSPIIALAATTGLPLDQLSGMVGRHLVFVSVIVPFWLIWAMAGRKAMMEVWPACLTAGGTYAVTQFLLSNYHGPWIVAVVGAVVSMQSTIVLLKFWQPETIWRFEHDREIGQTVSGYSPKLRKRILKAWVPWILVSVFVFVWALPPVKEMLNGGPKARPNILAGITFVNYKVPGLDKGVIRTAPVVPTPTPEPAVFTLNWLSATGTALLIAGCLGGLLAGFSVLELIAIFWGTLLRVRTALLTCGVMAALGFSTRYAGLDATIGLAFASTGFLFPFFSPLLGWLGVIFTGSNTSSNVLFGNLQKITAQALGFSPILAAAANSSGGVLGKMVNAQSLVIAGVVTDQQGEEGTILRYVFWHSAALAGLAGLMIFVQASLVSPREVPAGVVTVEQQAAAKAGARAAQPQADLPVAPPATVASAEAGTASPPLGAPTASSVPEISKTIRVGFAAGSVVLSSDFNKTLEEVAQRLQKGAFTAVVVGHSDTSGATSVNKIVALARARAVAEYLVSRGVQKGLIVVQGAGADLPIASNDTPEGRALNRRVEIDFVGR